MIRYVNVYEVTRHYGGPEEGGWWYNIGEPLASMKVEGDNESAQDVIDAAIARFEKEFSHHNVGDIYSVNGGVKVRVMVQGHEARFWPEERPHYE